MNCFIISSQNTFARHPETPRITTARSLVESVKSSRCASILGISTSSYEGFSTPIALFFRHIHTMRSVGGRNSAGSGASRCIWHGLGLGARIVSFVQQQSLEKTTSSPCTAKISVTKIGQRRNLKTAAIHSVGPFQFASLSTPSLVGLATIPCTLPCTLPSSLPAVHLREGNSGSRPIQSSAIAFSAAVSQISKPSYSGDTSSKVFSINSSAVSAESPLLWQAYRDTSIQAQSLFCTCRCARACEGVCL